MFACPNELKVLRFLKIYWAGMEVECTFYVTSSFGEKCKRQLSMKLRHVKTKGIRDKF